MDAQTDGRRQHGDCLCDPHTMPFPHFSSILESLLRSPADRAIPQVRY